MWLIALQRMAMEFVWHVAYFPLWWYTAGAVMAARACYRIFQTGNEILVPGLWLRNLFVPMFGQVDWQGRIMSFFMRLVNIIFRSLFLCLWMVISAALFLAWLAAPIFVVFMLIRSYAV